MLRLAVLEAVSAGLLGDQPDSALLTEGLAMWRGLIADLLAVPGIQVDTLLLAGCHDQYQPHPDLHVWYIEHTAEAALCWTAAVEDCHSAFIIAPECQGQLGRLVRQLPAHKAEWLSTVSAIELCTDKARLAAHLTANSIPTIPGQLEDWTSPPSAAEFPCIVKPIDGAGSWLVRRLDHSADWEQVRKEYQRAKVTVALRQPWIRGRAVSVAAWVTSQGIDWLPVADQILSDEGHFHYLGGSVPTRLSAEICDAVQAVAAGAIASIDGCRGYLGCDLVCPDEDPAAPLLVEINPRLTTTYTGYRQSWPQSPWPLWLSGRLAQFPSRENWRAVEFSSDGTAQ